MPADRPTFSIVTPTLNRLAMLKEAVESVRRQRHSSVEHIVVDGGSSDGTREWVEAQMDLIFLPPPDRGVYDAMNKGIAAARGDWIGLLNSDDLYEDGAFAAVTELIARTSQGDVVSGISSLKEGETLIARYDAPSELVPTPRDALVGRCLPNPRFFSRSTLATIGPIDISLGLVGDRDLLVRLIEAGARTLALDAPVYVYRRHDGSLTFDADLKLSQRLRRELVVLGRRWRTNPKASAAARAAGRELEGRQRIALAAGALRSGKLGEAAAQMLAEEGRGSIVPASTIAYATYAALMVRGSAR